MNKYDGPRSGEMTELLNFLYKMSAKRPLDHGDVVNVLSYYGLKQNDRPEDNQGRAVLDGKAVDEYFKHWTNRYERKEHIKVFVRPPSFCQFRNNVPDDAEKFAKLYIPLDYEHLYDGANILFDFMERNNIPHASKVARKVRLDNVIVRLRPSDRENATKIINFVKTNPYLKAGLNKPNPFIPTVSGIGYMQEPGYSYNSDIAFYIAGYINNCRKHALPYVNAEGFREYLQICKKNNVVLPPHQKEFDDLMLHTFDIAYTGVPKAYSSTMPLTTEQKRKILIDVLRETYKAHGINQVKEALRYIIKYNNFEYMSNGGEKNLRARLKSSLSSDDVLDAINTIIQVKTGMHFHTIEDKIDAYCMDLFASDLPFILDEACLVTYENHNKIQVELALDMLAESGSPANFSKFRGNDRSINYRMQMTIFTPQTLEEAMIASLGNKGVYAAHLRGRELRIVYLNALLRSNLTIAQQTVAQQEEAGVGARL